MSAAGLTDLELLRQVSQGADTGLTEFVNRYEGKLYTLFHCIIGEVHDSGEMLAEVFLKLVRRADTMAQPVCVCSEIFKTAVGEIGQYFVNAPLEAVTSPNSELCAAIYKLPLEYKLVLVLRDVLGLSGDQCSTALELSPEESAHRLKRARLMLRRVLLRDKGSIPADPQAGASEAISQPRERLV